MAILSDYHMHSCFSGDSETPMKDMVEKAVALGLKHICFTDHEDIDIPAYPGYAEDAFEVDLDSYTVSISRLRERYSASINIGCGIELGLQTHLAQRHADIVNNYAFDFVIGSSHLADGRDPYLPEYFEGRSDDEGYRSYFASISANILGFSDFDVYGHLDYVVRYGASRDEHYTYSKYADELDAALRLLTERGKGIEINTSGLKYGLKSTHPSEDIIRRYRELGGEIITVGSDAHIPEHIAYDFDVAEAILKRCGFRYYTTFIERKPVFHRL